MRTYISVLCAALLLTCVVSLSTGQPVSAGQLSLSTSSTGYDLVGAVNALRASNGLPAYNVNSILMTIAQDQADYLLATGGANGHVGPGGTLPYQRALNAGYSVENALSNPPGLFSENWDANSSIEGAITAWEGDSEHRIALYSTNLYDIGGGVASAKGMNYYVIDTGSSGNSGSPSSSASSTGIATNGTAVSQSQLIPMAIVSTPDQTGAVYHVVQPGQALWQIAMAYKVKINDIMTLNSLSSSVIYPGQKLLIMRVGTPTAVLPTLMPTPDLSTFTPLPTLAVIPETASATVTSTATTAPAAPDRIRSGQLAVVGIILVALIAAGLVSWMGRQRPV
ncbi:MAG TPA: LysM peptidoglycan-binding domain-containing protein [Anaerolineales bacterium]|nr:LysM peptidoglycan-binding domain-containing protein [Anaerolineales bacterium]